VGMRTRSGSGRRLEVENRVQCEHRLRALAAVLIEW
jgi:hypothetical protein